MTTKKKGGAPASNKAVDALYAIAEEIYEELDGGQIPKMKIPLRTKGNIPLEEITRGGDRKRINCRDDVGDAGYTIPYNVEKEKIKFIDADAKFILAIETGGMFDRLVENGFDDDAKCVLVHLKGQPSRSTRRLLKRLNEEMKLPVATFTDSDPWSFRIHAAVAYGAIKTAHISEYLATPTAEFVDR